MPVTLRAALDALAALTVTSVAHNYAIATVPDALSRAQLPALLVLPGDTQDDRLFKERGRAFDALTFSGSARVVAATVTHLLVVAPVEAGSGARSHLPRLIDLTDAYLAALGGDVLLGGLLVEPAVVRIEHGVFTHGGVRYHGCAFRHLWKLEL